MSDTDKTPEQTADPAPDATSTDGPFDDFLERLLSPISDEAPCGEDITYEDEFRKLKEMIDDIGSVGGAVDQERLIKEAEQAVDRRRGKNKKDTTEATQPASPVAVGTDFARIVDLAERLLRQKSKDLRIAAYLAFGLSRTEGVQGAAKGTALLCALVDTYWDDLYPVKRRLSARRNTLQFAAEKLTSEIKGAQVRVEDVSGLSDAVARMQALQAFVMREMEDKAPVLSGLTKALESAIKSAPAPEAAAPPEPEPAPEAEAPPEPEPKPQPTSEAEHTPERRPSPAVDAPRSPQAEPTPEGAHRPSTPAPKDAGARTAGSPAGAEPTVITSENEALIAIRRAAGFLLEANAANPTPYAVLRDALWSPLTRVPPAGGDGRTRIGAPLAQRRTFLEGLAKDGDHLTLVQQAERTFADFRFWLDAQRLVATGLEALGASYAPALRTVQRHTAELLDRLPGLVELTFDDGTPFADGKTRAWCETHLARRSEEAAPGSGEGKEVDAIRKRYDDALKTLASGSLEDALKLVRTGDEASGRDRFRRRLYSSMLCMKADQPALARPGLESLADEARRVDLENWEPGLAVEVWKYLYLSYKALAKGKGEHAGVFRERADEAYQEICRLDLPSALALGVA